MTAERRQYALVTAAYWMFTLTDGALRMLVLLHFHALGYSALAVASLFLFYELFGVVTNLVGGWLGARIGLNRTLYGGLGLQVLALGMMIVPAGWLAVPYVMTAQAFSGIAKDLTKMSSKSTIKLIVAEDANSTLFKWVAILTGSKNALKGVGFFLGSVLLTTVGFRGSFGIMAGAIALVLVAAMLLLTTDLGKTKAKPKWTQMFAKTPAINLLSAARCCLFGARDVWFVVGLPVFLTAQLGWDFWQVGGYLALWVIGYGMVQAIAPRILRRRGTDPDGRTAVILAGALTVLTTAIAFGLTTAFNPAGIVVGGLILFGIVFALNSAVHSYLILAYTDRENVAMNVGFYYMANASGRLLGTILSGVLYQVAGLAGCLWAAAVLSGLAAVCSIWLPHRPAPSRDGMMVPDPVDG